MNMFVGSAAVAGAAVLPCQPAAAKALVIETEHASQELRDLILALLKVNDVLKEKQEVYDAIHEQYLAWNKINPEPRKYGTRVYRKWEKRYNKFMDEIGYYDAKMEQVDAFDVQREARRAVAKFESRHLNDIALKVAAAVIFEGDVKGVRDYVLCQGVTIDMARMSSAGSYPVAN